MGGFSTDSVLSAFAVLSGVFAAVLEISLHLDDRRKRKYQTEVAEVKVDSLRRRYFQKRIACLRPRISATLSFVKESVFLVRIHNEKECVYSSIFYFEERVADYLLPMGDIEYLLYKSGVKGEVFGENAGVIALPFADYSCDGYPREVYLTCYDGDSNLWEINLEFECTPCLDSIQNGELIDVTLVQQGELL